MYCTRCGANLGEEARFCTSCGMAMKTGYQTEAPEIIDGLARRLKVSMILWIFSSCWFTFVIIFTWGWVGILLGAKLIQLHFGVALERHEELKKILKAQSEIMIECDATAYMTRWIIIGIILIEVIVWFWLGSVNYLLLLGIVLGLIDLIIVNLYVRMNRKYFEALEQI